MIIDLNTDQLAIVDRRCNALDYDDIEPDYNKHLNEYYGVFTINSMNFKASDILKGLESDWYDIGLQSWLDSKACKDYYLIEFNKKDSRIYKASDVDYVIDINNKQASEPIEEL